MLGLDEASKENNQFRLANFSGSESEIKSCKRWVWKISATKQRKWKYFRCDRDLWPFRYREPQSPIFGCSDYFDSDRYFLWSYHFLIAVLNQSRVFFIVAKNSTAPRPQAIWSLVKLVGCQICQIYSVHDKKIVARTRFDTKSHRIRILSA